MFIEIGRWFHIKDYVQNFFITWCIVSVSWQVESVTIIYWHNFFLFSFSGAVFSGKGNKVFISFLLCIELCLLKFQVHLSFASICDFMSSVYVISLFDVLSLPMLILPWLFGCICSVCYLIVLHLYLADYINGFHMKSYNISSNWEILNKSAYRQVESVMMLYWHTIFSLFQETYFKKR